MDACSVGVLSRAASPRCTLGFMPGMAAYTRRGVIPPESYPDQPGFSPSLTQIRQRYHREARRTSPQQYHPSRPPQPSPSGSHFPSRPCSEPRPLRQTGAQRHRFSPHQARLTPELRQTQGAVRTGTTEASQQPRQYPPPPTLAETSRSECAQLPRAAGGKCNCRGGRVCTFLPPYSEVWRVLTGHAKSTQGSSRDSTPCRISVRDGSG